MKDDMKKAILTIAVVVLVAIFAGCDAPQGLMNVREKFPVNEVVTIPGTRTFIMRTPSGEIWYAADDGTRRSDPSPQVVKLMEAKQ
jgi:hypothetical protein